eukprot:1763257-Prymnesium_polylepis.2
MCAGSNTPTVSAQEGTSTTSPLLAITAPSYLLPELADIDSGEGIVCRVEDAHVALFALWGANITSPSPVVAAPERCTANLLMLVL